MVPSHVMTWIAAIFPVISFLLGFALQYLTKRAWIPTIVVFGITLASMLIWFSMHFWSWLLLYLFICWAGCWAGATARDWMHSRAETV